MTIVPARPAATIMLLRDGTAGLEVFMTVRHRAIEFASGALVFPGGRVEDSDHAIAAREGLHDGRLAPGFFIAGIRETFEECGILLARPRRDGVVAVLHAAAGEDERAGGEFDGGMAHGHEHFQPRGAVAQQHDGGGGAGGDDGHRCS
jgi:8-oxo-dGTP pyrophosphatase MutT (NUDIX family)